MTPIHKIKRVFMPSLLVLLAVMGAGCGCTQDEEIRISGNLVNEAKVFSNNQDMIYDNSRRLVKSSGQDSEVISQLGEMAKASPNNTLVLNNLAFEYYKAGRSSESLAIYNRILEIDPAMATAHNNMGLVFFQMGDMDRAIECFKKCVESDPSFIQAYASLGLLHFRRNEKAEAIRMLEKAIDLNAAIVKNQQEKLKAAQEAGLDPEVLKKLETELNSQKANDAIAHNNLGLVFYESANFDRADLHFTKALEIDPAIDVALYNIAKIAVNRKNWVRAREMVTRYLSVRPDNDGALEMLKEIDGNLSFEQGAGSLKIPMAPPQSAQGPIENAARGGDGRQDESRPPGK